MLGDALSSGPLPRHYFLPLQAHDRNTLGIPGAVPYRTFSTVHSRSAEVLARVCLLTSTLALTALTLSGFRFS
jgi:hypothetical protein